MKISAIIQARMGSTRLPGKVLKPICGQPMIGHIIKRLCTVEEISNIIVATSDQPGDDPLAEYLAGLDHVICFRGSEHDVLERYYFAQQAYPADAIVRVTGDNPMTDPLLLRSMIMLFMQSKSSYATTEGYPLGIGAEIFSAKILEEAYVYAGKPYEREHVTPYMYAGKTDIVKLISKKNHSNLRLTVDTDEDFRLAELIYEKLGCRKYPFYLEDILLFLEQHPKLLKLNQDVRQKNYLEAEILTK